MASNVPLYQLYRASQIGLSEKEIYKYLTTPTSDDSDEDQSLGSAAGLGTRLHEIIQALGYKEKRITDAEHFVLDEKNQITGHIDLITKEGYVGDIKTVSESKFAEYLQNGPPQKYVSQLNFYLNMMDQEVGFLQFVSREDPSKQYIYEVKKSEDLFNFDIAKLNKVREKIRQELKEGKLDESQLAMTSSLEAKEEEAAGAIDKLKANISNLNKLSEEYISAIHNLSTHKLNSNSPINGIDLLNRISGLPEGWSSEKRKEVTPFGSPLRIGEMHRRASQAANLFTGITALDIETRGLHPHRGDKIVQIGIVSGSRALELNLIRTEAELAAAGPVAKKIIADLVSSGANFTKPVAGYIDKTALEVAKKKQLMTNLVSLTRVTAEEEKAKRIFKQSLLNEQVITIHNAIFENRFLNEFGFINDRSPEYSLMSPEYKGIIAREKAHIKNIRYRAGVGLTPSALSRQNVEKLKFRRGNLPEAIFQEQLRRGHEKYNYFKGVLEQNKIKALKGRHVIDTQEMTKYAYALMQDRGYIPKTYDIFTGSNLDFISKYLLTTKEIHSSTGDAWLAQQVAPRLAALIEKLKNPTQVVLGKQEQDLVSAIGKHQTTLKVLALRKRIQTGVEELSKHGYTYQGGKDLTTLDQFNEYLENDFFANSTAKYTLSNEKILSRARRHMAPEFKTMESALRGTVQEESLFRKFGPKVAMGGIALAAAAVLYTGFSNAISGKDDDYNTIEGLKHGWFGKQRLGRTGFGSGWQGIARMADDVAFAIYQTNRFSGKDDEYNTIEGLPHTWNGNRRSSYTDFGSGYKYPDYQSSTDIDWSLVGGIGLTLGVSAFLWNRPVNIFGKKINLSDLSYHGSVIGIGRTQARYKDLAYNAVRRLEYTLGGIPRTLSLSTMMSGSVLREGSFSVNIADQGSELYKNYLNKITGRDLITEGIETVRYEGGKVYGVKRYSNETIPLFEHARLFSRIHDPAISTRATQFTESLIRTENISSFLGKDRLRTISPEKYPFLIVGAESEAGLYGKMAHAFAHETFSKYLRLMDDPFKIAEDVLKATGSGRGVLSTVGKLLPKFGVGGEVGLQGNIIQLMARHAKQALPLMIGLPAAYSLANWAVKTVFPSGTAPGDAGLTGALAWTAKTAHITAAHVSQMTGLTSLRKGIEEQYPGSTGIAPFIGLAGSGFLTGYMAAEAYTLGKELFGKDRLSELHKAVAKAEMLEMPKTIAKLPWFGGKYNRMGRWGRWGMLIGGALGLPLLAAGIGTEDTPAELEAEYSGKKEVPVYKGRWWEAGITPYKGCLTPESSILTFIGDRKKAKDIRTGDEIIGIDGKKYTIAKTITRETNEPVYYVSTTFNRDAEVGLTGNHNVLVVTCPHCFRPSRSNVSIFWERIDKIKNLSTTRLFIPYYSPLENLQSINIGEIINQEKMSDGWYSKERQCKYNTTIDKEIVLWKGLRCRSIDRRVKLLSIMKENNLTEMQIRYRSLDLTKLSKKGGQPRRKKLDFPNIDTIDLTYDFGKFCGFYAAEGCIIDNSIKFAFHKNENNYINFIKEYIYNTFKLESDIRSTSENGIEITINSSILTELIRKLIPGTATNGDKIFSKEIMFANNYFIYGLVDGFIAGDGSIKRNSIRIGMHPTPMMKQFQLLLTKIKIYSFLGKKSITKDGYSTQEILIPSAASEKLNKIIPIKEVPINSLNLSKTTCGYTELESGFAIKINSIKIEEYNGIVYDFEVPGSNSFVGPGFLMHNSQISYFRPNWYARLMSGYKEKSIYEDNADEFPLKRWAREFLNPYEVEDRLRKDRPYPVTGPSGEAMGIFGPLYEMTLGRLLKPPRVYNPEFQEPGGLPENKEFAPSYELGGLPQRGAISPYDYRQQLQQQWYTGYEAAGLRGFIASAVAKNVTGGKELYSDTPILEPGSDITSTQRDFWGLNLGGGFGLTEAIRRIIPRRTADVEYVNPLPNNMPSWMPGEDYYLNYHQGDPYTKVDEGEYRLPGKGYEARYPELKGMEPENYPLAHKYKILADVAMYSHEFRQSQAEMQELNKSGNLNDREREIYTQTEQELKEKRRLREFRDPENAGIIASYAAALTDLAKANPLEQLLPLSPAHKFLPASDAMTQYQEQIYGRDFKLWEKPIEHFIEPAAETLEHRLGWNGIPEKIQQKREIEDYFDKLKYAKAEHLEREAKSRGDSWGMSAAIKMKHNTLAGTDPYSYPYEIMMSMPKSERSFFQAFLDAPDTQKEKIQSLVPENMQDFYQAQWDKQLYNRMKNGEVEGSPEELESMRKELTNRRIQMRARRQSDVDQFMSQDTLPPDDWIGWRSDVDMKDVQLKYLINEGLDYHDYNLWENRVRALGRKPYLEEAVKYVKIPERNDLQSTYDHVASMGVQNVDISIGSRYSASVDIDLDQDRSKEIDQHLRQGGHIR